MEVSGNFILGLMISVIVLLGVVWSIEVQTRNESFDVVNTVVENKSNSDLILKGKNLFVKESCYNCHKVDKLCISRDLVRNISERRSKKFLFQFIRNEDSLLKAKHPAVLRLKEEYKGANGLHNKKHLTDNDLEAILTYLDNI